MTTGSPIRWGTGGRVDSESFAREQILEAARRCYEQRGVNRTTVEDVARAAKVSRTTVYRYFRNRDEVLTGVVLADSVALLAQLEHALAGIDDFADFLIEGMLLILREAPRIPLYNAFLGTGSDSAALVSRLCISSEAVRELIDPVLMPRYQAARAAGHLPSAVELPPLVEWAARFLLSFMMAPGPHSQDEAALRRLLETFLRPALVR